MQAMTQVHRRYRVTLAGALREDIDAPDLIGAFRAMTDRYPDFDAFGWHRKRGDKIEGRLGGTAFHIEEVQ